MFEQYRNQQSWGCACRGYSCLQCYDLPDGADKRVILTRDSVWMLSAIILIFPIRCKTQQVIMNLTKHMTLWLQTRVYSQNPKSVYVKHSERRKTAELSMGSRLPSQRKAWITYRTGDACATWLMWTILLVATHSCTWLTWRTYLFLDKRLTSLLTTTVLRLCPRYEYIR